MIIYLRVSIIKPKLLFHLTLHVSTFIFFYILINDDCAGKRESKNT